MKASTILRFFGIILLVYGLTVPITIFLIQLAGNNVGSAVPITIWQILFPINYLLGPSENNRLLSVAYALILMSIGIYLSKALLKKAWKAI